MTNSDRPGRDSSSSALPPPVVLGIILVGCGCFSPAGSLTTSASAAKDGAVSSILLISNTKVGSSTVTLVDAVSFLVGAASLEEGASRPAPVMTPRASSETRTRSIEEFALPPLPAVLELMSTASVVELASSFWRVRLTRSIPESLTTARTVRSLL